MVNLLVQANLVAIIFLTLAYVLLFGLPSVEKYFERGVIILKQEEHPLTIIPPGKIIWFIYTNEKSQTTYYVFSCG